MDIINEVDPGAADGQIQPAISRSQLVNGEMPAPSLLTTSRPGRVFSVPIFGWASPENIAALESVASQIHKAEKKRGEADTLLARRAAFNPAQSPPADLANAPATAGMLAEQADRLEAEAVARFLSFEDSLRRDLAIAGKSAVAAVDAEITRLEKAVAGASGWAPEQVHCIMTSPVRLVGDPPSLVKLRGVCAGVEGQSQALHDSRKRAGFRYRELTQPPVK